MVLFEFSIRKRREPFYYHTWIHVTRALTPVEKTEGTSRVAKRAFGAYWIPSLGHVSFQG